MLFNLIEAILILKPLFGGHFVFAGYLKLLNVDRVSAGGLLILSVLRIKIHQKNNYSKHYKVRPNKLKWQPDYYGIMVLHFITGEGALHFFRSWVFHNLSYRFNLQYYYMLNLAKTIRRSPCSLNL